MVDVFTRKVARIFYLLPLTFVGALLIPLSAMAESETLSCADAHTQIEHTQKTLQLLEQHQQELQQHVRNIYQELLVCQTATSLLTQTQQEYCTHLQEEGPKQFQSMVKAITLSHKTSQQLAHQTRQAQFTCPAMAENTFPKIASLEHS